MSRAIEWIGIALLGTAMMFDFDDRIWDGLLLGYGGAMFLLGWLFEIRRRP